MGAGDGTGGGTFKVPWNESDLRPAPIVSHQSQGGSNRRCLWALPKLLGCWVGVNSADPARGWGTPEAPLVGFYHVWPTLPAAGRGQNVAWSCHPCQAVESRQVGCLELTSSFYHLDLKDTLRLSFRKVCGKKRHENIIIWSWSDVTLKCSRKFLDILNNSASPQPLQSFTSKVKINLTILHLENHGIPMSISPIHQGQALRSLWGPH